MHLVIIGSTGDVRVNHFQERLQSQGLDSATLVTYADLIEGKVHLNEVLKPNSWIRIESPGRDQSTNHLLLKAGLNEVDEVGDFTKTTGDIPTSKGLILAPRQWYLGLRHCLKIIENQLSNSNYFRLMNSIDDILVMFDKPVCHQYLQNHHLPVPPALPTVTCFNELESAMKSAGLQRVFIKIAHGSSASGVIAYETNGIKHKATTTIEMVEKKGQVDLYNSRKIQIYRDHAKIAQLIDALCSHRVHVEAWIPKARMEDKIFDLRVVVINGMAAHVLARLSKSPMTNLHLLNERRHRDAVIQTMGETNFCDAMQLCGQAMTHFPHSMYTGIDVLVSTGYRKHYIIEMNAFGDLLHDTYFHGVDPYTMQIQRMVADGYD